MFVLYLFYTLAVLTNFLYFVVTERNFFHKTLFRVVEILAIIIFPLLFLLFADSGVKNDCCYDETLFSPVHRPTVYTIIMLCGIAYFVSSYRKSVAPPLIEIIINCLLIIGIILNVFIAIHYGDVQFWLGGNGSIILLFTQVMIKNQRLLITYLNNHEIAPKGIIQKICWQLLQLNPFIKNPLLVVLCLPILTIITGILIVFGQKPDSLIRAFTDTYRHGFSQLDHECDNVICDGHYLCTVAAKGHKKFVKPQRLGERGGRKIICNRQLLVSNAFEELLQEKLPFVHKRIRKAYNHVGKMIHRYYGIFNNKYVADVVYILMKPLEWFFVIVLYTFDSKPENRIAKQYLSKTHRVELKMLNN